MVPYSFRQLLAAAARGPAAGEEGVLSRRLPAGAVPAQGGLAPITALLSRAGDWHRFRFLWGWGFLALACRCAAHSLELRRSVGAFELGPRFSTILLSRLVTVPQSFAHGSAAVLLAFSFSTAVAGGHGGWRGLQAVLPRCSLSRQGLHCWLRLQRPLGGGVTARQRGRELWEEARRWSACPIPARPEPAGGAAPTSPSASRLGRRATLAVSAAPSLSAESGELRKLVVAGAQRCTRSVRSTAGAAPAAGGGTSRV